MAVLRLVSEEGLPEGFRPLVLEVSARSETPLVKLFERLPRDLAADRLDRRRFLISGPLEAFRTLIRENLDLKFAKGLLLYLLQWEPSLVADLKPRHGLIPPQDLSFTLLSGEEVKNLSPALKARHLYFGVEFRGPEALAVEVLKSRLPVKVRGNPGEEREIFLCASLADLVVYLLNPLLEEGPLSEKAAEMLAELKATYPECFGEGG